MRRPRWKTASGKIELIAFSTAYQKLAEKLKIDVPVLVRGVLRGEDDSAPKLSVSNIQALEDVELKLPESLRIKVPLHQPDAALLEKLHAVFLAAPGKGKVLLDLEEPGEFCAVLEPHDVAVAPTACSSTASKSWLAAAACASSTKRSVA